MLLCSYMDKDGNEARKRERRHRFADALREETGPYLAGEGRAPRLSTEILSKALAKVGVNANEFFSEYSLRYRGSFEEMESDGGWKEFIHGYPIPEGIAGLLDEWPL